METKEKILEKTFQLLLSKGYDGVSISDIHVSIGISRGLIYHYFESKERLFIEAMKHEFTTGFNIDLQHVASFNIDQMTSYIVDKYKTLDSHILRGGSILDYDFLFYRAMQESDELTKLYIKIREDEQKAWFIALNNSSGNGLLRPKLDLEKLSKQYIYITDGVWLSAVIPSAKMNMITELDDALDQLNRLILQ